MDILDLPFLKPHQTLLAAAHAMAHTNCHAVVVETAPGLCSIRMNTEIRDGIAAGKQRLNELGPSALTARTLDAQLSRTLVEATRQMGAFEVAGGASGFPSDTFSPVPVPFDLSLKVEESLDQMNVAYGVVHTSGNTIRIATRHEGLAYAIRDANKVCICDHNPKHTAEEPPQKDGTPCVFGDGTYECF